MNNAYEIDWQNVTGTINTSSDAYMNVTFPKTPFNTHIGMFTFYRKLVNSYTGSSENQKVMIRISDIERIIIPEKAQ